VSLNDRIGHVTLLVMCSSTLLTPRICPATCVSTHDMHFTPPRTVEQLLQNLRLAFNSDELLDPAFFVDSNLTTFFNAKAVTWGMGFTPLHISDISPEPSLAGVTSITAKIWLTGQATGPLLKNGSVEVQLSPASGVTLGAVRRVFGTETKVIPKTPPTDMLPNAGNTADLPDPSIEYAKVRAAAVISCQPVRVVARFSAHIEDPDVAWQHKPVRFPDDASVTSIWLDASVE